jgi:tetratricopeptide (TPR) repeat protein
MEELKKKIEELWDQGDINTFSQFEQEIKGKVSDKDVDGSLTLALFYYRYSLLYDEKANTAKQHWVEGPKFSENEELWDKGGKLIDKALDLIEKGPNDPTAVLAYAIKELGRSPKMGGNPRNAINFFKKVIELDPNHAEGHFWFGRFYMHPDIKSQPKLALPYFEKAASLNPNNWLYRENIEQFKKAFPQ